ncbi:adenylate kinase isoenzyme 1 [Phymastichus coffea]|uniref:adenylate kinase isoenzyme 1 n=1 Tax=Phymastichus coffea TaxID=108790 RepID=UPI00273AEDE6|nr:adenylate kinase isoenzyme 1 [Phymastichus coffea]
MVRAARRGAFGCLEARQSAEERRADRTPPPPRPLRFPRLRAHCRKYPRTAEHSPSAGDVGDVGDSVAARGDRERSDRCDAAARDGRGNLVQGGVVRRPRAQISKTLEDHAAGRALPISSRLTSHASMCECAPRGSATRMKTIWIIGGPGCGKGTQCERIIAKYGFAHLSSGDLLREEVASGSPRGAELQELMSKGLFVPTDVVLTLIKERIAKARSEQPSLRAVLVDGYPRELEQGLQFEKDVSAVDLIIFFDVRNETLVGRLLGRAAAAAVKRDDDNEETIKKRIEIFNEKNGKIVEHYKDKCLKINAEGSVDDVFSQVSQAIDKLLAS